MELLRKGHYLVRSGARPEDIRRAQALRHLCFHQREGLDSDEFDARCQHVLVEDLRTGDLVSCYRLMHLPDPAGITGSYSAQFYDLGRLSTARGPMVEMGRFCIAPGLRDPDILRLAWGAMTQLVDQAGARLLFGCASFHGTDISLHTEALALLRAGHLAPPDWQPGIRAPRVYEYATELAGHVADPRRGLLAMPPLLRSYLAMGGRVSDHAVIDDAMQTLHVFTGVDISAIPETRARALRMVAQ